MRSAGGQTTHFANGLDLTGRFDSTGAAFYAFDGSGNTVQLTGATGAVVNSYSYLPYGEQLATSATVDNPFTFGGEFGVTDTGDGTYFMRSRAYDPATGDDCYAQAVTTP